MQLKERPHGAGQLRQENSPSPWRRLILMRGVLSFWWVLVLGLTVAITAQVVIAADASTPSKSELEQIFGPIRKSQTEYLKNLKCSELFAADAPDALKWSENSDLRTFAEKWAPVCSVATQHWLRYLNQNDSDVQSGSRLVSALNHLNGCEKQETRYENVFSPATKNLAGARMLTSENQQHLVNQFAEFKRLARDQCCDPSDKQCKDLMQDVSITFCSPLEGESCLAGAAYQRYPYNQINDVNSLRKVVWTEWRTPTTEEPRRIRQPFQMTAGRVVLSPYERSNGDPVTTPFAMLHEFGHACSHIQKQLMITRADTELAAAASQHAHEVFHDRGDRLRVSPAFEKVYRHLFQRLKMEDESFNCLSGIAPADCAFSRPVARIEEDYADFFALMSIPREHAVPAVFPAACLRYHNNDHGSNFSKMGCFVKSEVARTRLKELSGCKN